MRWDSIAAVTVVVSLLLVYVAAEECELAQRVRKYEVDVFKQLYFFTASPNTPTFSPFTSASGRVSGTRRRGCIGWQGRYWSYELCPGRWVRQYRLVDGVVVEEFILGVQDRWYLMDEVGSQSLRYKEGHQMMPHRLQATGSTVDAATAAPYRCVTEGGSTVVKQVDVVYAAGTYCELGFQRSATLHLVCDKAALVPHVRFGEPFVCNYDITVVSAAVCDAMEGRVHSQNGFPVADMFWTL